MFYCIFILKTLKRRGLSRLPRVDSMKNKLSLILYLASKVIGLLPSFVSRVLYFILYPFSGYALVPVRYVFLSGMLSSCGRRVAVFNNVEIKSSKGVFFGDNVSVHPFCYIDGHGGVSVGDNVSIAHATSIVSFDHTWADVGKPIKYNPSVKRGIVIEDDVWIGCGVRILAGTYIESRVVVAAGAVVKGRLESGWLYGGMPAKKIKALDD